MHTIDTIQENYNQLKSDIILSESDYLYRKTSTLNNNELYQLISLKEKEIFKFFYETNKIDIKEFWEEIKKGIFLACLDAKDDRLSKTANDKHLRLALCTLKNIVCKNTLDFNETLLFIYKNYKKHKKYLMQATYQIFSFITKENSTRWIWNIKYFITSKIANIKCAFAIALSIVIEKSKKIIDNVKDKSKNLISVFKNNKPIDMLTVNDVSINKINSTYNKEDFVGLKSKSNHEIHDAFRKSFNEKFYKKIENFNFSVVDEIKEFYCNDYEEIKDTRRGTSKWILDKKLVKNTSTLINIEIRDKKSFTNFNQYLLQIFLREISNAYDIAINYNQVNTKLLND